MKAEILDRLRAERAAKRPVALLTNLKSGAQDIFYPTEKETQLLPELQETVRGALRDDRSRTVETADGPVFVHVHNPPLRLVIVGAVHIAQPLSRMAALSGYAVTVIDPRRAFAANARFDHVAVSRDWPDEALAALAPDGRMAVVMLTHDPKLDDPALHAALGSSAFYIGALGSRRTQGARLERLREAGFDDDDLARIHAPVGLDIGARTAGEIAAAILAAIAEFILASAGSRRESAADAA